LHCRPHPDAGRLLSPCTRLRLASPWLHLCLDWPYRRHPTAARHHIQRLRSAVDMVFCSPCHSPVATCITMSFRSTRCLRQGRSTVRNFVVAAAVVLTSSVQVVAQVAPTGNETRSDHLVVEPPTLVCAGFQWIIAGDNNRNASVAVSYRKVGEQEWRPALPLLRIGGEQVYGHEQRWNYTTPHKFAGSIFGLEPATHYECRFILTDP